MVSQSNPHWFRHGPLDVAVRGIDGIPDLEALVGSLRKTSAVIWLDSARKCAVTGRWSLVGAHPWLVFQSNGDRLECRTTASTEVRRGDPLEALASLLTRYHAPASGFAPSRAAGLMGFLSYDMNVRLEPAAAAIRPAARRDVGPQVPDMLWFGLKVSVLADHLQGRCWIVCIADPHLPPEVAKEEALRLLEEMVNRIAAPEQTLADAARSEGDLHILSSVSQEDFEVAVERVLEHIREGDIFQANLSQRFLARWPREAWPVYQALRRRNPSPFAAYLEFGGLSVASCSPERLVRVQDGRIDTRPIAGTRPRGASADEDTVRGLELLLSEKEQAEHRMLVDLARNDLGRVCRHGSVAVNELMTLETYSHVIHIVSDVSGAALPDAGPVDVIRALFPGGTITGCPKVRCMQILGELETVPRGLYTGSLGYIGFDGTMDLNIAIRTLVFSDGWASFHAGAGIVADSDPTREYHETLAKAAAMRDALEASAASEGKRHAAHR